MARGKHHKPLFELLGSARVPEAPEAPVAPEPVPVREPVRERGRESEPAFRRERSGRDVSIESAGEGAHRRVAVPILTLYMAATFVVVLCIVCFSVGYSMGGRPAAAETLDDVVPPYDLLDNVIEPGRVGGVPGDERAAGEPGSDSGQSAVSPPKPARGDLLGPDGALAADPRAGGNNYLQLAMLDRAGAEAALRVLKAGGIEAMAVRPARSSRYRVIALDVAVSSGRFRAAAKDRSEYERRIGRIGSAWKRDGGVTDFGDPFWVLYSP